LEQSARRCHIRTLSADVQTPLKDIFVLSLLQHYLILLVCYSDSVVASRWRCCLGHFKKYL